MDTNGTSSLEYLVKLLKPSLGAMHQLQGDDNQRFIDSICWHIVLAGKVLLFTVCAQDGQRQGRRRFLFEASAGELLWAGSIDPAVSPMKLLAVTEEESQILQIPTLPPDCLREGVLQGMVEQWIAKVGRSLTSGILPPQPTMVTEANTADFCLTNEQGLLLPPTSPWVEIIAGKAEWLGLAGVEITAGAVPLPGMTWITAKGEARGRVHAQEDQLWGDRWLAGISSFQFLVLQALERQDAQLVAEGIARQQEQLLRDRQTMSAALKYLVSPEQERSLPVAAQETSLLLQAARLVVESQGLTLQSPAQSENLHRLQEPLQAVARASGVRIRRIKLGNRWWRGDYGPLLGFTGEQEPVALLPLGGDCYRCINPATGERLLVTAALAGSLDTTAYTFFRPFARQLNGLAVLRFALTGRRNDLFLIGLMLLLVTGVDMLIPIFTGRLVSEVLPNAQQPLLLQMGGMLLAAALGSILFNLTKAVTLVRLEIASELASESAIWDRLLRLPADFFRRYNSGDLGQRLIAMSEIHRRLSGNVLNTLLSSLFGLVSLGLMFFYSQQLTWLALLFTLIVFLATVLTGWLTTARNRILREIESKLYGIVVQLVSGVSKLRVSGSEQRAFIYWSKQYGQRAALKLSVRRIDNRLSLLNEAIAPVTSIALFWAVVISLKPSPLVPDALTIPAFVAFNVAFGKFQSSALSLSSVLVQSLDIINLWQRVQPILRQEPEITTQKIDPGILTGRASLDRITFRYRADGPLILTDVSLHTEPGEFIALVGPSGSGKSTVLRLLLGFEQPETGVVYYDGQELSKLDVQAIRRQLGVVLQHSRLMSASIFDNICGTARATQEEVWQAAASAGIADDIAAMPMGLQTLISEGGTNLSGGQRQRILIARALLLKPKILLFDEATSALDNRTQSIVSRSIEQLQVTRIVIAHRLSTIQQADRIYVFDNGQVVQQGTFPQLTNQEGRFAQLVRRQMVG